MQANDVPLTRAAYEAMQQELERLRTQGRREVAQEIRQAWDQELDTTDNDNAVPLTYAKEGQAFLEGRIAELEDTLARATIIDEEAARASETIQLGSVVVIENGDGHEHTYQIVGTVEADPAAGKISRESPVGAALLGKRAGDTVEVEAPAGVQHLRIKALR
jgi:transcription elongation factor GreA